MTDPLVGTHLDEYLLEDLLGHGGMARVYRGLDTGLERYAAVKVIDTPYQQDEDYIARFEKEAKAIAQLDHPHIVTVYRYGSSGQLLYLAMKYVEGADLHSVLTGYEDDNQRMPDAEVVRLLREIGSALDYAHSQGVVHRDIKPSNIMLDPQGRSYLTDFGLALLTDVGTQGEILGSPHYIAPEQAVSSAGAVAQSDLYALGVILYRMVTGTLPFDDEDVLELLMLHMTALPPLPRTIRSKISPAVEEVLLKALAKEPSDRYQSGTALADAYAEALATATAVPLAAAAPTLTIMDRVALDMETLPPTVDEESQLSMESMSSTPLLSATQPVSGQEQEEVPEEGAGERRVWPIAAVVGVLLLLCLAFFFFRGRVGDEEEMAVAEPSLMMSATDVPARNEAGTPMADEGEDVGETAVTGEAENTQADAIPLPEDIPSASSGTVYIPVVTDGKTQEQTNETVSPIPQETETPLATETSVPTPTTIPSTDTPVRVIYQLLIDVHKEDSLFIVNQSNVNFPLTLLSVGNDKGMIQGDEWGIGQLAPGDCVTAWKDGGKPKAPDVECDQVGERLERAGSERFWKDKYSVFYEGEVVIECKGKKSCEVEIFP